MKNKFLYIGIALIVVLLAVLVGCTAGNDGKAGYVRDIITSQTPTNLTGPIYGTGSAMAAANLQGVVFSNNGSAPSVATAAQLRTASHFVSGNATFGSGDAALTVTHTLGVQPTWIIVSWMSAPGGAYAMYTGSATDTTFLVTSTTNVTGTPVIGYIIGY
ncbi:MAG: hypothetical protein WC455_17090 [Dehalococcoidia bacterium]|jgi:hypothetical protein